LLHSFADAVVLAAVVRRTRLMLGMVLQREAIVAVE